MMVGLGGGTEERTQVGVQPQITQFVFPKKSKRRGNLKNSDSVKQGNAKCNYSVWMTSVFSVQSKG